MHMFFPEIAVDQLLWTRFDLPALPIACLSYIPFRSPSRVGISSAANVNWSFLYKTSLIPSSMCYISLHLIHFVLMCLCKVCVCVCVGYREMVFHKGSRPVLSIRRSLTTIEVSTHQPLVRMQSHFKDKIAPVCAWGYMAHT